MVSAGHHGVACRSADLDIFVPAPAVAVANPIGAGDALLGATLVALERGANARSRGLRRRRLRRRLGRPPGRRLRRSGARRPTADVGQCPIAQRTLPMTTAGAGDRRTPTVSDVAGARRRLPQDRVPGAQQRGQRSTGQGRPGPPRRRRARLPTEPVRPPAAHPWHDVDGRCRHGDRRRPVLDRCAAGRRGGHRRRRPLHPLGVDTGPLRSGVRDRRGDGRAAGDGPARRADCRRPVVPRGDRRRRHPRRLRRPARGRRRHRRRRRRRRRWRPAGHGAAHRTAAIAASPSWAPVRSTPGAARRRLPAGTRSCRHRRRRRPGARGDQRVDLGRSGRRRLARPRRSADGGLRRQRQHVGRAARRAAPTPLDAGHRRLQRLRRGADPRPDGHGRRQRSGRARSAWRRAGPANASTAIAVRAALVCIDTPIIERESHLVGAR